MQKSANESSYSKIIRCVITSYYRVVEVTKRLQATTRFNIMTRIQRTDKLLELDVIYETL